MITGEMLKTAAIEADQAIRDSLPAPEECGHAFSPSFQKKMRQIFRRAKHPALYKLIRSVACVILAVILTGGVWLTIDAQARETFIRWVREVYGTYSVYYFRGAASGEHTSEDQASKEQASPEYSLAWIPDGYTEWKTESIGDDIYVVYVDDRGNLLTFGYLPSSSTTYMFVETTDYTKQSIYVGNIPADFYLSHSPDKANSIIWRSTDGETVFYLDGFFSKEELIEMAENVQTSDEEQVENYAPTWLPEGYEETGQTVLPVLKNVVYTNADGQRISFSCTYGENGGDTVYIDDYGSVSTVQVGNVRADFYQASQEGEGNALVWQSNADDVLFCMISPLPKDVLVKIAESVEIID